MEKFPGNEKGFFSLIGMLVALALICFFVYYMMNTYFKAQVSLSEPTGINSGAGNSPVKYESIVTNTRSKVEEINKKSIDQFNQAEEALK